jgi:hypothetical protein
MKQPLQVETNVLLDKQDLQRNESVAFPFFVTLFNKTVEHGSELHKQEHTLRGWQGLDFDRE